MHEIWDRPLEARAVEDAVRSPACGALVVFTGVVRDCARGREVTAVEYQAHRQMAEKSFRKISDEVRARWGISCAILHRVGLLKVGEASVMVAVAAPHRREAFEACSYAMERVKEISPIWKKEFGTDGSWWVEGETALLPGTSLVGDPA